MIHSTFLHPKQVGFVLAYNGFERMTFYMVQSVLVLYLRYFVGFNSDDSVFIYHAFMVLGFLFTVLGAAVADSFWGRYKTILVFGLIYAIGLQFSWFGTKGSTGLDSKNCLVHGRIY